MVSLSHLTPHKNFGNGIDSRLPQNVFHVSVIEPSYARASVELQNITKLVELMAQIHRVGKFVVSSRRARTEVPSLSRWCRRRVPPARIRKWRRRIYCQQASRPKNRRRRIEVSQRLFSRRTE